MKWRVDFISFTVYLCSVGVVFAEPIEWVRQSQDTKAYDFEVGFEKETPRYVRVISHETGKTVQTLSDIDGEEWTDNKNEVLRVIDANFDSYLDIVVHGWSGGASPNNTDNYYLYNPKDEKFVFDKQLSELTQLYFDTKNKKISTEFRDGCCHHGGSIYRYINGALIEIANWDRAITADGDWEETTTGKLVNGKMKYHIKRRKANLNK